VSNLREDELLWCDVVGREINDNGFMLFLRLPMESNDKSEPET